MHVGEVLHVIATDPSTALDFFNFCRFMGHQLVDQTAAGDVLEYWIEKGA
jgi:tRNA 2-thiouridine synthesizing protein A